MFLGKFNMADTSAISKIKTPKVIIRRMETRGSRYLSFSLELIILSFNGISVLCFNYLVKRGVRQIDPFAAFISLKPFKVPQEFGNLAFHWSEVFSFKMPIIVGSSDLVNL